MSEREIARIGGKTVGIYIATTAIAVTIGLVLATTIQPGRTVPPEVRAELEAAYAEDATTREAGAKAAGRRFVLEGVYGAGLDHPALAGFPEGDYLKFAVGRVP